MVTVLLRCYQFVSGSSGAPPRCTAPSRRPPLAVARTFGLAAAGLMVLVISGASPAIAQPPAVQVPAEKSAPAGSASAPRPAGVEEGEIEIVYLRDANGNLVPVADTLFEEFERWAQRNLAGAEQPPRYVLEQMRVTGRVTDQRAHLDFVFKVVITGPSDDWTAIPLRLGQAKLREAALWEGPGEHLLDYDTQRQEYVGWIRADENSQHELVLKMVLPLADSGGQTRLSFSAPRASFSELQLTIPEPAAVARLLGSNDQQELVQVESADDGSSLLRLSSVQGEVLLGWRPQTTPADASSAVLKAQGALRVAVLGQQHVHSEARLEVQSFGGPVESFLVRLPPGMRLGQPLPQQNFQITPVPATGAAEQAKGQVVRVVPTQPANDLEPLQLLAEMVPNGQESAGTSAPSSSAGIEVSGFEVIGAVQQWGHIDVTVEGDWAVEWREGNNVRRVDTPSDVETPLAPLARFEYYRQPFSLRLQVAPRQQQVSVSPSYELYAAADRVALDAVFDYQVRGNRAYSVDIDFPGWKIDRIFPESLVDSDAVDLNQVDPLSIRLTPNGQVAPTQFSLRVQAHRDIPSGAQSIAFELPRPRDSLQAPALISIRSAKNVVLTPRTTELSGLVPEMPDPSVTEPAAVADEPALTYRERGGAQPAYFAADLRVRKRSLLVDLLNVVELDEQRAQIEQELIYRISYEPIDSLILDIPRTLLEEENLSVLLGTAREPLPWFPVVGSAEMSSDGRAQVKVYLLEPRLGPCQLTVRHVQDLPELSTEEPTAVQLPLVLPAPGVDTEVTSHALHITAPQDMHVETNTGEWLKGVMEDTARAGGSGTLRLTADASTDYIPLLVTLSPSADREALSVAQAWVQTWLTPGARQHRAVLRIEGDQDPLRVQLPEGATLTKLAVDGVVLAQVPAAGNQLRISNRTQLGDQRVLDIWFSTSASSRWWSRVRLELPQILQAGAPQHLYWQILTPQDEHLVWMPRQVTPEWRWVWQGLFWGRVPTHDQHELADWIGVSRQVNPLPQASNQYLVTSFGPVQRAELVMARRSSLVLICSLIVLAGGLLLTYFPSLRHPAWLLVVGVAVAGVAIILPSLGLLAAQAASVGVVLSVVAQLLKFVVGRRRSQQPIVRGSAYTRSDSNVSELQLTRAEGNSNLTATAAHYPLKTPSAAGKS